MVGEARLTAQGSGGAALLGGAASPDVGLGVAGAVIDAVARVVVACGVLATVESPEPQPVKAEEVDTTTARAVNTRQVSDHTSRNRTVSGPADATGVPAACRLPHSASLCPTRIDEQ